MWAGTYALLFALATIFTYVWAVQKETITFSAAVATGAWFMLAFGSGTLQFMTDSGEQELVTGGADQVIFFGLGVLSILAILLHQFDAYPPEDSVEHELGGEEVFQ